MLHQDTQKMRPPSLDDLLHAKDLSESANKPKFLTKKEREEAAIERRRKQLEEQKGKLEKTFASREEFFNKAKDKDLKRKHDSIKQKSKEVEKDLTEQEKKAIRERFMGSEKKKRRIRRLNDKKFVFDWEVTEDTLSADSNPIYSKPHVAQMFGRGTYAGIDIKEQRKDNNIIYEKILSNRRSKEETSRAVELQSVNKQKENQLNYLDRHWSQKDLSVMKERDWRIFKEDYNISTKGGSIPNPIRFWNEANISRSIKDTISKVGYKEPTPIQRQAIPIGLQNRDIIGIAETGSGKTAAFLIPMLDFIERLPPLSDDNMHEGPYALILVPTRELAQQIEAETLKFATPLNYRCVSIVGGHSIGEQSFSIRNGIHIVIATPGRLKDCLEKRILVLNQCSYVVMDEADRMVDMGFEEDVNFILDALPVSNTKPDTDDAEDAEKMNQFLLSNKLMYRQTTMFSATMPTACLRLAKKFLRRPAQVIIGNAGQAVDTVEQRVEMVNEEQKKNKLLEILKRYEFEPPIIIFVNQQKGADLLSKALCNFGFKSISLHGKKSQDARSRFRILKSGSKEILVATDVAGRGIDIKDVSLVLNYDAPKSIEAYVHRIGRTGRAGKSGVSITFLTADNSAIFYDLRIMLQNSPISKCPSELASHPDAIKKPGTVETKKKQDETIFTM